MPHFRVDDAFHSHPKAQRVGDDAIGLWTRAGSFCMAYLTDGFVPEWWVKQQPKGTVKARKLVAAGLWNDGAEREGEQGYQFHEFVGPGRQDSREKIEADRELARKRKEKSRRESRQVSQVESQRDTPRDDHRESHTESRRSPGYTQPNPTQPSTSLVNSSGGVTSADARETTPPPRHCPKHMPDGTTDNCGACADARRAHTAWMANASLDEKRAEQERAQAEAADRASAATVKARAIAACKLCDPDGYRGTTVCDHQEHADTNAIGMAKVRAAMAAKGSDQ